MGLNDYFVYRLLLFKDSLKTLPCVLFVLWGGRLVIFPGRRIEVKRAKMDYLFAERSGLEKCGNKECLLVESLQKQASKLVFFSRQGIGCQGRVPSHLPD